MHCDIYFMYNCDECYLVHKCSEGDLVRKCADVVHMFSVCLGVRLTFCCEKQLFFVVRNKQFSQPKSG